MIKVFSGPHPDVTIVRLAPIVSAESSVVIKKTFHIQQSAVSTNFKAACFPAPSGGRVSGRSKPEGFAETINTVFLPRGGGSLVFQAAQKRGRPAPEGSRGRTARSAPPAASFSVRPTPQVPVRPRASSLVPPTHPCSPTTEADAGPGTHVSSWESDQLP